MVTGGERYSLSEWTALGVDAGASGVARGRRACARVTARRPRPPVSSAPRCKHCSNTLHSGGYRATAEPGVFVCSSHAPDATSASSTDSKPPSAPQKAQGVRGQRDVGPGAKPTSWQPVGGSSAARGTVPTAATPPTGSPSGPRFSVSPVGGKASMRVTNSSPTGWSSPAQDMVAVSPRPAVTASTPSSRPATPQGQATARVPAPQTKFSVSPAPPGPAGTPAWAPLASRTPPAQEKSIQTPRPAPTAGAAARTPAPAGAPSGVVSRAQALSCLRKALPGLGEAGTQVPGRCVGVWLLPARRPLTRRSEGLGQLGRVPGSALPGRVTVGLQAPASVSLSGE